MFATRVLACTLLCTLVSLTLTACGGGGGGGGGDTPAAAFSDPIEVRLGTTSGALIANGAGATGDRLFGRQNVGASSTALTIVIGNGGTQDLTINAPAMVGANPGEFTINASTTNLVIPAQMSTSFTIAFSPTSAGVKTASVSIPHDAVSGASSPFTFDVAGEGEYTGRVLEVHAMSLSGPVITNGSAATGSRDFGLIDPNGGATATATFTIANVGTEILTITSAPALIGSDASDFILDASLVPGQIPAGATVNFTIAFDPADTGTKTALLNIGHNAANTADPFTMEVTGEGDWTGAATMDVEILNNPITNGDQPGNTFEGLNFGLALVNQAGATRRFNIDNTGPRPITIGTPNITGTSASAYTLDTSNFDPDLDIGESTYFEIEFAPLSGSFADATLSFTHTATDTTTSPFSVGLSGIAPQGGTAWAWGSNGSDRLGLGFAGDQQTPQTLSGLSDVTGVATGDEFSAAITADGKVYVWGNGDRWHMGMGSNFNDIASPTLLPGIDQIVKIEAALEGTLALRADGTLWAWGYSTGANTVGNTQATTPRRIFATADDIVDFTVGDNAALAVRSDGTVWHWGRRSATDYNYSGEANGSTYQRIPGLFDMEKVEIGLGTCAAIDSQKRLWLWSRNSSYELGDTSFTGQSRNKVAPHPTLSGVVDVAIGDTHVMALLENGDVYTWGGNTSGQIGDGTVQSAVTPQQVSLGRPAVAIGVARERSYAVLDDGTTKAWGNNTDGFLGTGGTGIAAVPFTASSAPAFDLIQGADSHVLGVVRTSGASRIRVYEDSVSGHEIAPIAPASGKRWFRARDENSGASAAQDFVIQNDGQSALNVQNFQLAGPDAAEFELDLTGIATTVMPNATTSFTVKFNPTSPGAKTAWIQFTHDGSSTWPVSRIHVKGTGLAAGGSTSQGVVYRWQSTGSETAIANTADVVRIESGQSHHMALTSSGRVLTWGQGSAGQLGVGSTSSSSGAVLVTSLSDIVDIAASRDSCYAVTTTGELYTWGRNDVGQLGLGNTTTQSLPQQVTGITNAVQVQAGVDFAVVRLSNGTLKSFGGNSVGQLGDGTTNDSAVPLDVPGISTAEDLVIGQQDTSVFVRLMGDTWMAWGRNNSGNLGDGSTTHRSSPVSLPMLNGITQLCSWTRGGMALQSDGTLLAWGANGDDKLGTADSTVSVTQPTQMVGPKRIVRMQTGYTEAYLVDEDGSLFVVGKTKAVDLVENPAPGGVQYVQSASNFYILR